MNFAREIKATGVLESLKGVLEITGGAMAQLHGPKMDGPRNDTERALVRIDGICCDAFNELKRNLNELEKSQP